MKKIENIEKSITVSLKNFSLEEIDDFIFKLKRFRTKLGMELNKKNKNKSKIENFLEQQSLVDPNLRFELKSVKFTRPAKYEYFSPDGVRHTWAGVGRKPKWMQKALDDGANLCDFEIKSDD